MNKKTTTIALVILVIIVLVFVVLNNKTDDTVLPPRPTQQPAITPQVQKAVDKLSETLETKHQYADGRHTFLGSFEVPNSCYNYSTDVIDNEIIEITYIQPEIEECPSPEPIERGFYISFEAPENQVVRARVNGEMFDLKLVEVPADQDIETF